MWQTLRDFGASCWRALSQDLVLLASWAAAAGWHALVWIGTLLVVVFVGSALALALLSEWFFDTSILDEEQHEQKTTTAKQGYFSEAG